MRLAHYRIQWQAPVNAVIKTFRSIKGGQFVDCDKWRICYMEL